MHLDEKESFERIADMADLLGSVIAAHGGLDRWRTVRAIDVTFNFYGGLLDIKGFLQSGFVRHASRNSEVCRTNSSGY